MGYGWKEITKVEPIIYHKSGLPVCSCGTYTVQLVIIDANQCTDLITLPVDVYCQPIANFLQILYVKETQLYSQ